MTSGPLPPGLLDVARLLSADGFVSGEALAERLGASRATVHNRLRALRDLGLAVHSLPGRGYRLARPVNWLDPHALRPGLAESGFELHFHDGLASTNSALLGRDPPAHRAVALAEWQHAGRGRRGRGWHAPLGGGLTFSLAWHFQRPMAALAGLSLAVGLAVARAAREQAASTAAAEAVQVKWPNDVLFGGAKLAGILIEVRGDALGPCVAVIGIGINAWLPDEARAAIDQPVADLVELSGRAPDRNLLLRRALAHLDQVLARFEEAGFAALRDDWQALHAWQGRLARLTGAGEALEGRVLGVDTDGALLLDTAHGPRRVLSGEMSLRGAGP